MNPHASKVVTKEVVEGVPREERQAVGDPVGLFGIVVEVGLGASSKVTDRLGSLLVGARPDAKADTIKGMGRVLLQDKSMVDAMGLATSSADFDVMREACL